MLTQPASAAIRAQDHDGPVDVVLVFDQSEPDERLAPGATTETLRAALAGRGDEVVVVGHQPDCGRIAAELSGGAEPSFPPAGLVVLEL